MTKNYLIILCFLLPTGLFAQQNLVPNPSFEDTVSCPDFPGQVDKAVGWSTYRETPDYFNSCSSSSIVSVPENLAGHQYPSSGNAYCGFQTFSNSNFREFLGRQLSEPMVIGETYNVSFKTVRAHGGVVGARCATNKTGIRFSTVPFSFNSPAPVDNFAHIYTNDIITDTLNWTTISGTFTADFAYQYIIIGNFFDDNNTDTLWIFGNSCRAYYYVDDIVVEKDNSTGYKKDEINKPYRVFPNPAISNLNIELDTLAEIVICNSIGDVVFKTSSNANLTINISDWKSGFYFFKIKTNNKFHNEKLIINP
ncbi:MAG: T9SS type A sorting domain-containing protein [Bacteroidota bacterium]|nr:T9SS type A sorting domain-containing protein [Bacteroidota bacterium]